MVGDESARFATQRMLSEAKVKGSWAINQWQLSQSGAVTYFDETSNARTGSLLQSALTSRDRGLAHFHKGQYREAADAFRLACDVDSVPVSAG